MIRFQDDNNVVFLEPGFKTLIVSDRAKGLYLVPVTDPLSQVSQIITPALKFVLAVRLSSSQSGENPWKPAVTNYALDDPPSRTSFFVEKQF